MIKTCGSDEINCPDNRLHDMIHYWRLATQCLLVRNTVIWPKFTSSTYNPYVFLNFVSTPAFFPIIDGVLSVVILTARDQSTPTLFSTPTRVENNIGCCGIRHKHQPQEFHSDRQSLINATNEYGSLYNVRNVSAFIERNWKRNKQLDFVLQ